MEFFRNLFWGSSNKSKEEIKLYFDRLKKSYLKLKINGESTCKELITSSNKEIYNCLALKFKNEVINLNDYSFVLINSDSNNLIEIKLKLNDNISKYLNINTIDIYFLNLKEDNIKNKEVNKIISKDFIQSSLISKFYN